MRLITIVALLFSISMSYSQGVEKAKDYKASNGITYKVGDTLSLGRGSDTNGKFVYATYGGWSIGSPESKRLPYAFNGRTMTIKKIKVYNKKRVKKVIFTVGGGSISNFHLDIENAIETCEIKICSPKNSHLVSSSDKYDQLSKLKKLFDEGVLTESEYNIEKKKILNQQ